MFIHIGQNAVVAAEDVVAIFDLDNTTHSIKTREFLRRAEAGGNVITVSDELPRSFIVTHRDGSTRVFISPIATATLQKRAEAGVLE
ncbi:MAG: extracellular matrix regulator RemB [Oscillospiraceae bacterium]|jgi:hypothetical protein